MADLNEFSTLRRYIANNIRAMSRDNYHQSPKEC